jgi:hypothetical protein
MESGVNPLSIPGGLPGAKGATMGHPTLLQPASYNGSGPGVQPPGSSGEVQGRAKN